VLILAAATVAHAQELTPRAYWPSPKGTTIGVLGFAYSTGDVLFDPSIPLYGVDSRLSTYVFAWQRTLSVFDRTATLLLELPYSDGTTHGQFGQIPVKGDYAGRADMSATFAVNLCGAPSMTAEEFLALRANPHPMLGASVKLIAPSGRYSSERILNVGANRWAIRPEIGYMAPLSVKWFVEARGGAWFFGDDEDFVGGYRKQDPVYSAAVHLIRRFSPGFWVSLDTNYFTGGRQTIDGVRLEDVQRNSKLGATLVKPFKGRHAVKLGYSTGVVTEFGTDFSQFLISYQFVMNR